MSYTDAELRACEFSYFRAVAKERGYESPKEVQRLLDEQREAIMKAVQLLWLTTSHGDTANGPGPSLSDVLDVMLNASSSVQAGASLCKGAGAG